MSIYAFGGQSYRRPHYGLGQSTTGESEWDALAALSPAQRLDKCHIDLSKNNINSLACEYAVGNDIYNDIEELKYLCKKGYIPACAELKNKLSPEELAESAKRREQMAEAERQAIADRLRAVGQYELADAVEKQQDVIWIPPGGFSELLEMEIPGYVDPKKSLYTWIAVGAGVLVGAYFILRRPR